MWAPLLPTRLALHLGPLPYFHYNSSCGCPSFQITSHCIWAPYLVSLRFLMWFPIFPTHLALNLRTLPCFRYDSSCECPSFQLTLCFIWVPYVVFVMIPHAVSTLLNSTCIAFGCPSSFSLRFLMWEPLFPAHLVLCLGTLPHFH
jgi:hypothetical protein